MLRKQKERALQNLALAIKRSRRCPLSRLATQAVPGEGPSTALIMLIGEAPGREEDKTGRPFIGLAGKFLDRSLKKIGLKRSKIFITSVEKYMPPSGRKPTKAELEACDIWWRQQLAIIQPKIVVLLGEIAYNRVLYGAIGKSFSHVRGIVFQLGDCYYIATYHPSAARRFPKIRQNFNKDFKKLKTLIHKIKK